MPTIHLPPNSGELTDLMTARRDNRLYGRTQLSTSVTHDAFGELLVRTRDISYGGVHLLTMNRPMPPVGTIIKGQVQDDYGKSPVVNMQNVGIETEGVGLMFVE